MTADKRIKVACYGAGYFSQFHYDSWRRIADVDLVASCNRSIEKAKATGLPAFDNLANMLAEVKPDLLDIIVSPDGHKEAITTALDHGIKYMICQKPFCMSLEEATEMSEFAKAAGAKIIIHENFRFQPWYRNIHALVKDGAVGDVHQVTFRLRPGDGQGPRAYLDRQPYFQEMPKFLVHETAVHWVDTFRYLLGNPTAVYADLRKRNPVIAGEDAGYILFDHPNGAASMFDGNRHLDHAADNLRRTMGEALVEGTEGSITLLGDGSVWLRDFQEQNAECILPPDTWDGFGGDCVHALQSHVVDGILGRGDFENQAKEYLRVIEIENAIYLSSDTGQKIELRTD